MTKLKQLKVLLFIIFFILTSINVLGLTMAVTTANSLNLRNSPAGEVIGSLPKGSLVGIVSVQGDWVQILYMKSQASKEVKSGWVSSKYLQIISRSKNSSVVGSVSGDDCEYEYDTDSEVCVTVTNVNLDCRKGYDGSYYRSCDVEVDYEISTNYEGNGYLDLEVECNVDIRYKGRESYSWRYDSDYDDENHSLYSSGSESADMSFDFSFSSYKEVIRVKVDSVTCEIESVSHY